MNVPPEAVRVAGGWAVMAEGDLRAAELLLASSEGGDLWIVCFHAQQCAEKYLKALLTLCAVDFPRVHDLTELLHLVPGGIGLGLSSEEIAALNPYAVDTRYPGDWTAVDPEEAGEAVALARKVRDEVRKRLPQIP